MQWIDGRLFNGGLSILYVVLSRYDVSQSRFLGISGLIMSVGYVKKMISDTDTFKWSGKTFDPPVTKVVAGGIFLPFLRWKNAWKIQGKLKR